MSKLSSKINDIPYNAVLFYLLDNKNVTIPIIYRK